MWHQLTALLQPRRTHPLDVIAQVEEELAAALCVVAHWIPAALERQQAHLQELRVTWAEQAAHLRTLDRMLVEAPPPQPGRDHWRRVRQRSLAELLATLAWVRELASMIRLAQRTGAPAARAEELLAQIATAGRS